MLKEISLQDIKKFKPVYEEDNNFIDNIKSLLLKDYSIIVRLKEQKKCNKLTAYMYDKKLRRYIIIDEIEVVKCELE